jgi:hypothetical protein
MLSKNQSLKYDLPVPGLYPKLKDLYRDWEKSVGFLADQVPQHR